MKIPSAQIPGVSAPIALVATGLTVAGAGALAYFGGKAALVTAGVVGGGLFAIATTNVVLAHGIQAGADGVRALRKAYAERQPKPNVVRETAGAAAAAATS